MLPTLCGMFIVWAVAGMWLQRRVGRAADATHVRRLLIANLLVLVLGLVTALGSCAAPVAALVGSFPEVAAAPPEEKSTLLGDRINRTRPLMILALATPFIAGGAVRSFLRRQRVLLKKGQ
jgi:hypothetical protein